MSLTIVKPLTLPVFTSNGWSENYAVTGATDRGYSLIGAKSNTENGMLLTATSGTSVTLTLPIIIHRSNFEAEFITKRIAGSSMQGLQFRRLDGNNRMFVSLTSANTLTLTKVVLGVTTIIQTITGVTSTDFQRINVKAIGDKIEVFLNGILVITTNQTDLVTNSIFALSAFDAVIGIAQAEWQYIAIKPL